MKDTLIHLDHANLYYDSVAFKERSIKSLMASMVRFKRNKSAISEITDVHALKDISVDIHCGERIGLLGHNGAGKSTFLKMVAGLYPISSGAMQVVGTIRSLFDLSLGFEPEESGRENILYRGLLLGASPKQMHSIEQEIVEFADLGKFIDYPVKTYSAGMQVRLAFAISTTVGGDILLVDEVIGAGDANFMQKAKKRILGLIEQSEILILASHDIPTLTSVCERGLVFHHGKIVFDGPINQCVTEYRKINGLQ